jgi:hypothetical protein
MLITLAKTVSLQVNCTSIYRWVKFDSMINPYNDNFVFPQYGIHLDILQALTKEQQILHWAHIPSHLKVAVCHSVSQALNSLVIGSKDACFMLGSRGFSIPLPV